MTELVVLHFSVHEKPKLLLVWFGVSYLEIFGFQSAKPLSVSMSLSCAGAGIGILNALPYIIDCEYVLCIGRSLRPDLAYFAGGRKTGGSSEREL